MITFRPYSISRPSFGQQDRQEPPIHAFIFIHGLLPWQQKKLQEWEAQGVITHVQQLENRPGTVAITLAAGQDLARFVEKTGDAGIGIITQESSVAFNALKDLQRTDHPYAFATAFP